MNDKKCEKQLMDALLEERDELEKKLKKVRDLIEYYQETCNHNFEHIGNDSHYEHYKCKTCGYLDRV